MQNIFEEDEPSARFLLNYFVFAVEAEAPAVKMRAFCHHTLVGLLSRYRAEYCTYSLTTPGPLFHATPNLKWSHFEALALSQIFRVDLPII